jgi:hypothetical protein
MRERVPVGPYGEPAQSPEGSLWGKFPDELWGEVSKAVQLALRALLKAWNGLTMCELTREEIREAINELRKQKNEARAKQEPPLPPLPMIGNKRTISWYFAKLKELGIIERGRVEGKKTEWYTKFTKSFYAKLDDGSAPQLGKAVPGGPNSGAARSELQIDLVYAKYAVEFCEKNGWRVIQDGPSMLNLVEIEGREQVPLTRAFKVVLKERKESVLAFLKGTHQRE